MRADNPLIVQPDRSLMLHTVRNVVDSEGNVGKDDQGRPLTEEHPRYQEARDRLAVFAELAKSPDYLHTYRLNTISVWNAAALGVTAEEMLATLEDLSCVPIPPNIEQEISEWVSCYGVLRIERREVGFELISTDPALVPDVLAHEAVRKHCNLGPDGEVFLDDLQRGLIKQALIRIGFPVDDRGGYLDGDPLDIKLRQTSLSGEPFALREYQSGAAKAFHAGGTELGGSGVVVLPCGAGKTVTGMAVMELVGAKTLILTTNTVAVRQWCEELLDKTELTARQEAALRKFALATASDYCTGCSNICSPAVDGQVPVCDILRFVMYYNSYGDRFGARELFAGLPASVRNRLTSVDYSTAEARCPQGIPIAERMKLAQELLA